MKRGNLYQARKFDAGKKLNIKEQERQRFEEKYEYSSY